MWPAWSHARVPGGLETGLSFPARSVLVPFPNVLVFIPVSRAVLVRLEGCSHPVVMKGLCAECGQDLTQ